MHTPKFLLMACMAILLTMAEAKAKEAQQSNKSIAVSEKCVITIGQQHRKLPFDRCGATLLTDAGIYTNAQRKDKNSDDLPYLVFVPIDLKGETIWPLRQFIYGFFLYKNTVYFADDDGKVFYRLKDEWKQESWQLKPYWKIIQNDDFLIACSSDTPAKDGKEGSSCYAPEKHWNIDVQWRIILPRMCHHKLTVLGYAPEAPFTAYQFDPLTGKETRRKSIGKRITDVCSINFN